MIPLVAVVAVAIALGAAIVFLPLAGRSPDQATTPPVAALQPGATGGPASAPAPPLLQLTTPRTLPATGSDGPGRLETLGEQLLVWKDPFGAVRAQVIVTALNVGGSPVEMSTSGTTWTVSDDSGQLVAEGRFAHAFPPIVFPGGGVYLIDGVSATFAEPRELAVLDVEIGSAPVERDDSIVPLEIANLSLAGASDGGVTVTGEVTNPTNRAMSKATLGVVLKDSAGNLLGGVYDVAIGPLGAGATRSFETAYPGTPPIDTAGVATVEGAASGTP